MQQEREMKFCLQLQRQARINDLDIQVLDFRSETHLRLHMPNSVNRQASVKHRMKLIYSFLTASEKNMKLSDVYKNKLRSK